MPTLVVNQGALGDLLLSLPAFRLMRKHLGDFTLAGDPEKCLFLKESGEVSSVFPANSAAFAQLYSGTIPPHLEYFDDIWWFTRRRGLVPTILMMPDSPKQTKIVFTVDEGPEQTNCSLFQFDQVKAILGDTEPTLHDMNHSLIYAKPQDEKKQFRLAIHPGSGSNKKSFPLPLFTNIVARLLEISPALDCCFIIGPAEKDMLEDVEEFALRWNGRVKIASGFDLTALANLLGGVENFWGNDSGVSHLAAWCGARTFINFGPTNPRLWTPSSGEVTVFQSRATCSPCGDKYRSCEELVCLNQIEEDSIFETLRAAL